MNEADAGRSGLLEIVAARLDIPESYYRKAAARHRSICDWLNRPASSLLRYSPDVRPQGSFRYGTVIRPLDPGTDYDLDNVCLLAAISVIDVTQEQLKTAYGVELRLYAQAQNMARTPEEHNRCWRLRYADEVGFHLDSLPCISASPEAIRHLLSLGITDRVASAAVAITDRRHPAYRFMSPDWTRSNPRGFARWFESRAALGREGPQPSGSFIAKIEDVPPYRWKTSLQRSIQLLKRHRDVMFKSAPALAPISMIITNLAARAYSGDRDLAHALKGIIEGMPAFVNRVSPRVPNPALPQEDYADKWQRDPQLERNFWLWHAAASADLTKLFMALEDGAAARTVQQIFEVTLSDDESSMLVERFARHRPRTPAVIVSSGPKPWATGGWTR
jgi:hypothetical protein